MRSQGTDRVDWIIGDLADRQQGVVASWQLLAAGISADAIFRRVERGLLRPIHRGVYMVGHRAEALYARQMAAVLACGRAAAVSHRSAAAMMGFLPYPARANVWITRARGDHRKRPGIRVHAVRVLRPREVGRLAGVPLTSPARTLLDLAAVVTGEQLERAVCGGAREPSGEYRGAPRTASG